MSVLCPRCGGLMRWDGDLGASKCQHGHYDYPLIDGATLPRAGPPTGHAGIDFDRAKPIALREE